MQITIDTHRDSAEDIRKAISVLSEILGTKSLSPRSSNIFDNPGPGLTETKPADPNAFANMFSEVPVPQVSEPLPKSAPNFEITDEDIKAADMIIEYEE